MDRSIDRSIDCLVCFLPAYLLLASACAYSCTLCVLRACRVPFIVSMPGRVPQGLVSNHGDIMSADWLPTVASLAGYKLPSSVSSKLMGRDASYYVLGGGADAGTTKADADGAGAGTGALTLPPNPGPRKIPRMWDYRFDITGGQACWLAAPRLAIRDPEQPELKLLMNADSSRVSVCV